MYHIYMYQNEQKYKERLIFILKKNTYIYIQSGSWWLGTIVYHGTYEPGMPLHTEGNRERSRAEFDGAGAHGPNGMQETRNTACPLLSRSWHRKLREGMLPGTVDLHVAQLNLQLTMACGVLYRCKRHHKDH